MSTPRILMCPPDYYGIEYEINPWMSRSRPSNRGEAQRQWSGLRSLLEACGATIETLEPVEGLPDLVFTANAALVFRGSVVISHFRHPERQREEPYDARWFRDHGFKVCMPPEGVFFEGAGDALFCGDTLFAGYRIRSDARGHQQIGDMLASRVIPLELVDPYYYHLDTCFCPLAAGRAIFFPKAFDSYGRQVLRELVGELIEIQEEEARRFAANAVVVGQFVITNTGCPRLHEQLRALGYEPRETPLDEFVKAGGSAKCLTLRLDGEEAASWKSEPA